MHTYACKELAASLGSALSVPLLALSLHVDGRAQSCDDVAAAVAASRAGRSLCVLALADHAQEPGAPLDTLTDVGLASIGLNCPSLTRLLVDDAGAITVRGVAAFLDASAPNLEQLALRRCFGATFRGADALRELAERRGVQLLWEPRAPAAKLEPLATPVSP